MDSCHQGRNWYIILSFIAWFGFGIFFFIIIEKLVGLLNWIIRSLIVVSQEMKVLSSQAVGFLGTGTAYLCMIMTLLKRNMGKCSVDLISYLSSVICELFYFITINIAEEDKKLNATYIISVARKLGCSIFLLPEDIIEVRIL